MTTVRVLLLEPSGPEATAVAKTAATAGYDVHGVTDKATHAIYPDDMTSLLSGCELVDFTDPGTARAAIVDYGRRINADAVVTTNEYLTEIQAHACAELGVRGNDPALAHTARNKASMHAALVARGACTPRSQIVADADELQRLAASDGITYPCVVKPADAAGSAGVSIVRNPEGLAAAYARARGTTAMYGLPADPRVLVQEFVDGDLYSVESFTYGGHITHVAITSSAVTSGDHRVEIAHSVPARLPPRLHHAIERQAELAIRAVGICDGASHTELIITPDERCVVVEIAARLGAGQIPILVHHALGLDPFTSLLDMALGRTPDLAPRRHDHATVRFLTTPHTGVLDAVRGLPPIGPGIVDVHLRRRPGDHVSAARSNRDRIGHVILTGPDRAALNERARQLLDGIEIVMSVQHEPGLESGRVR